MIISIKSNASGRGSSRGLIHYLAHSKLDPIKEEAQSREFFNETENDFDVRQSNRYLSLNKGKPKPDELLHLIVAPSKEEIESVGDDLKTRKAALKTIVCETVAALAKAVKAKQLKWVAVTHFNTDHPHVHLALQKEFVNEKGLADNLRIKRQMLHYNEKGENGVKKPHKGTLILAAEGKLREIAGERQKIRENVSANEVRKTTGNTKIKNEKSEQISDSQLAKISNYRERRILAVEMLARAETARRTRNLENLIEHGDKKRFKIRDEHSRTMLHVSLFDIERKIEIISQRKSRQLNPKNAEKRASALLRITETERTKYSPLISQLETIRRHVLGFENRHLARAQEKHTPLNNQKLLIEKKYERLGTDPPLPLFTPDEIQQLQSEAIGEQNIEKTINLEAIRQSNAQELKRPGRRERDVRELLGAQMIAVLKLKAAEKRLADFPKIKDFIKVKIGSSSWSLNSLKHRENKTNSKNGFMRHLKTKTFSLFFPSEKKNSSGEKLDYPALKNQISDALTNLENERRREILEQKEFVQTLNKIFQAEMHPNKTNLSPAFSVFELAEIEDLAQSTGDADLYEKSLTWQENFLLEKSAAVQNNSANNSRGVSIQTGPPKNQAEALKKIIGKFVLRRAAARVVIERTKVAEAKENIARYNRQRVFIKHRIKDDETGAERELSLRDIEQKKHYYLLDRILHRALETKEQKRERELVREAAKIKEKELTLDLENRRSRLSRVENQKNSMQAKYEIEAEIPPVFTPKEIAALDSWKYQTTKKSEPLAKIITEAEKTFGVERIQDLINTVSKEIEDLLPLLSKKKDPENFPFNQKNLINTQEIAGQTAAAEEKALQPGQPPVKAETIERVKTPLKDKEQNR